MAETTEKAATVIIAAADLIAKFQYAYDNKWGYIWGTAGVTWTEAKQKQKVDYMVSKYGANWKNSSEAKKDNYYYAALYGSKWVGHTVADCSGLFAWAFKQLGGSIAHGSNSIYDRYCSSKGAFKNGKRSDGKDLKAGTAVFTGTSSNRGHIGLYIGNGKVIEAQGTQAGVVISEVTLAKWTWWGELKDVSYGAEPQPQPTPTPTPGKGEAIVTGKQVALRIGPSTSAAVLTRVATGQTVKIKNPPDDWEYVSYNGKTGYMMKQFLNEG